MTSRCPDLPRAYYHGRQQPCPAIGELKTVVEAKNVLGFEAATTLDEMLDEVIACIDEAVKNGTI